MDITPSPGHTIGLQAIQVKILKDTYPDMLFLCAIQLHCCPKSVQYDFYKLYTYILCVCVCVCLMRMCVHVGRFSWHWCGVLRIPLHNSILYRRIDSGRAVGDGHQKQSE